MVSLGNTLASNLGDSGSRPGTQGSQKGGSSRRSDRHGVVEMLEYVKALDIDPIREPDMLWIAEEAFNAQLPPNWGEYMDDAGRVYFYSTSTGESSWIHPMDSTFRKVVEYYRRGKKEGGFWYIEDEIL